MDKVIKPIETIYNGYRFRSRLEARWAVFFDVIGLEYQYEPEGFFVKCYDDTEIRYLPDFYFPEYDMYGEVKPSLTKLLEDEEKLAWMVDFDGPMAKGLIILGQIPNPSRQKGEIPVFLKLSWYKGIRKEVITFGPYCIVESNIDLYVGEGDSTAPELGIGVFPEALFAIRRNFPLAHNLCLWELDKCAIPYEEYQKARQARFEHGENPSA